VFIDFAGRSIREHPMLGVGAGNFPWQASYYLMFTAFDLLGDHVHNIYLAAWAELGTIGLLLYGAALLTGLGATVRDLWARPDPAGIALLGGVIARPGRRLKPRMQRKWHESPKSLKSTPVRPSGA